MAAATLELIAYLVGGVMYEKMGARRVFFYLFILAGTSAIGIIAIDEKLNKPLDMMCTYVSRFAIAAAY